MQLPILTIFECDPFHIDPLAQCFWSSSVKMKISQLLVEELSPEVPSSSERKTQYNKTHEPLSLLSRLDMLGELDASTASGAVPSKSGSHWSLAEDIKIVHLRSKGLKWADISRRLPGRTATSCRLHYQNYLEWRIVWDKNRDILTFSSRDCIRSKPTKSPEW